MSDKKKAPKTINQPIDQKWAKPPNVSPAPGDIAPLPPGQEGDGKSNPQQEGNGKSPPKQSEGSNTDSKKK